MRFLSGIVFGAILLMMLAGQAQETPVFDVLSTVRQGETIPVVIRHAKGPLEGASAWFAGKQIPLFLENTGDYVGLMPIGVTQKIGMFPFKIQDKAGKNLYTTQVRILDARFPHQNIRVSKTTKGLEPLPGEMEAITALKNRVTPIRFWEEPFISPTPDCMNSLFGVLRYHNGVATEDYHKGVDLRSPAGRPIRAIAAGKVQIAKMFRLHGGTVGLDHGQGVGSIYIHMSKLGVQEGDVVQKGDVIGAVGSTGFATGPHLHWGLYVNGLPVNPTQWLSKVPRCL